MTPVPRRLLHDSLTAAARNPLLAAKDAVICNGRRWSYRELHDQACALAAYLRRHGVQRGDRVAIYMDNSWPCVVSIFATSLADAVIMVVNPQTKLDKLRFMLADSDARALLSDGHLARQFLPVLQEDERPLLTVCSGELPADSDVIAFDEAVAGTDDAPAPAAIPLDLAALIYTSGSTGRPKGVMQTHQAMRFSLGSLIQYLRLTPDDRILCALPLAFDYGLYQLLMSVDLGATLVLERSFTFPAQVFASMQEHQVTVFPGVPTIFAMILGMHARQPLAFPSVRSITNTAAALPDDFAQRLHEVFPAAGIFSMYGLTECKRVSYLEPEMLGRKSGSVGKAIPGTEVFLCDEQGNPVEPGGTGILYVRGPHVMLGYWDRPEASARMLKPGRLPGERVLCTQDHFRMDEDGYLYFLGRSDDIIKSRGEKVSPVEVENVLHALPGVREAAVIGVPDETLGEAIRAYLVTDPEAGIDERRVRAHCSARLENFMLPRDVLFVDALPRTTTGKVSKKTLREQTLEQTRASG